MGSSQSVPVTPPPPYHTLTRQRSPRRISPPSTTLEEKFDAIKIDNDGEVTTSVLEGDGRSAVSAAKTVSYVKELLEDPKNRLGLSALSTTNPAVVLEKTSAVLKNTQTFNVAIPHEGSPVTNQRSSGRCWIFAACNVFRIAIMERYGIENFELSQAYLFFWDKVEKANYFLESVLETTDEDVNSRIVSSLMASPVSDGGQWDMIYNLVTKYGIVPQTLYPDSWNAQNSAVMDRLITTKLREDGLKLRKMKTAGTSGAKIASAKETMMQDIIRILTLTLGPPPAADEKFTWEFYDKGHKFKTVPLTPLEFGSTTNIKQMTSLTNDPRNSYNTLLTVDRLGNVWDGRPITYVNVDKDVLKEACITTLRQGRAVFFGSDVGKFSDSGKGIMDTDLVDYNLGFNVKLGMTKEQRLLTGESQMTHAMVLTAVHLQDGKPVRWRVENSWSESAGTKGYFVMSDKWMDEFCYQAVVDIGVLTKEVKDVLKQKPKVLPLWDPMGALA